MILEAMGKPHGFFYFKSGMSKKAKNI